MIDVTDYSEHLADMPSLLAELTRHLSAGELAHATDTATEMIRRLDGVLAWIKSR